MKRREAEKIMRHVCRTLPSQGWRGEWWENLGWHVRWTCGAITLHYSDLVIAHRTGRHFWATVGEPGDTGAVPFLTPNKIRHFKNPISAVRSAVKFAQKQLRPVSLSLDEVEAYL